MKYKGYIGEVKYDDRDKILHGRVINLIKDIITFEGSTVAEIEKDFKHAIDDYLEFKKERGEIPEQPFSGKFIVRLKKELHGAAVEAAVRQNISLNNFVEKAIEHELKMC